MDVDQLTVVIPVLNEEAAIGRVLDEVLHVGVPRQNVLVVDGGSTDSTREIAESKGVKVIMQEGRGKADAVETALKHVKTPYVLFMDGDYTYPATHIPELLQTAIKGGYDEVIGARLNGKENIPLLNRFGNWILNKVFNILFGTRLRDVLSGMYLLKTAALRDAMFEMRGFSIESEIAAHIASTTGKITEIPINYRKRIGKKKLNIAHGLQIGIDMVRLAWRYNPAFFIFALGALLLIPGLVLGAWVAYHYFFTGVKYYVKGLIAIILTLAGFQSLLMAVMAIYIKRVELRFIKRMEAGCD